MFVFLMGVEEKSVKKGKEMPKRKKGKGGQIYSFRSVGG
jgi:hypothetical protein